MKKPTSNFVVGLVVLCGLLLFIRVNVLFTQEKHETIPPRLTESQDTIAREAYIPEVVVQAPWGEKNLYQGAGGEESKPGEFGHYVSEETELGPDAFTVAPNGDIYISDPLNKRIQEYNSSGQFLSVIPIPDGKAVVDICADDNDNLFLLRYGAKGRGGPGCVDKCDHNGKPIASYPAFIDVKRTANLVHCDNKGRVFIEGVSYGFYQVGASTVPLSFQEQKRSLREGSLGSNSATADKDVFFKGGYLMSFDGDTTQPFHSTMGSLFGYDERLNLYTEAYDDQRESMIVRKYDPRGSSIAEFQYDCGEPYTGLFKVGFTCAFLDPKGNFYVFCESYKDGIKVIKWYKRS
ncbi:MAG: hypothetical protein WCE90_06240 [Candidatus Zixiibacteriota bacterium]